MFPKDKLHFYDPDNLDISRGKNYCFFDVARGVEDGNFPAVIWVNQQGDNLKLFDSIDVNMPIDDIIALGAERNRQYNVVEIVFDKTATYLVEKAIKDAHAAIGFKIIVTGVQQTSNKKDRIKSMQPQLKSGVMQFRSDYATAYPETMNQIIFFPAWGAVDYADTTQMAVAHLNKPKFKFAGQVAR